MSDSREAKRQIDAVKVHQWLREWDKVRFDEKALRREPSPNFYLFTLSAQELKALSGIYRRSTRERLGGTRDLGIQRRHDEDRSREIREFVQFGFPWSELAKTKREDDLRKPGWLPTAIVVNVLKPEDQREGESVAESDLVRVAHIDETRARLELPKGFDSTWRPRKRPPIEVIDGQHRLWAFERNGVLLNYQLPVVAFHGLDLSWQAYLFYTINVKPKRINASLAYDLYPLLRTEDWLEKFGGPSVYRETRAQELTEMLWAHPESPWYQRINMLGEPGVRNVSQAAWIRSLIATYVKSSEGPGVRIGGLFGAPVGQHMITLRWSRVQQGAFLIRVWRLLQEAVGESRNTWAAALRSEQEHDTLFDKVDLAFAGPHTLLNTDQGVRGILYLTNDFCFLQADKLALANWESNDNIGVTGKVSLQAVSEALKSSQKQPVWGFIKALCQELAKYDWRTSSASGLSPQERTAKLAFRGSGGYSELRRQLLSQLAAHRGDLGTIAKKISAALGYSR